jgi:hypothetical protein
MAPTNAVTLPLSTGPLGFLLSRSRSSVIATSTQSGPFWLRLDFRQVVLFATLVLQSVHEVHNKFD